ncbi:MAG: transglutaminaseTgpA domain-containing protein, partial [Ilumatobacteraceae bacterium]
MKYRLGRLAAVPSMMLLALTVVTAVGFRRVYEDWSFLAFYVAVAAAVHVTTTLCRFLRIHVLAATPLALLTGLCAIAIRMYPTSVRLGFLPSATSFRLASDDIAQSWREFTSTVAPVPATGGFLLLGALAIVVVAYTSDTFALRAYGRVESVIPAAVLFTFVSVLGEPGYRIGRVWITAVWMFVGCLTIALVRDEHGEIAQNWLGGRHAVRLARTGLAAALMSLAAAGLAYAVAPQLPGAKEVGLIDTSPRSGDESSAPSVSPLVDIRGRLTGNPNRIMFRVTSKRAAYWRLTSLPDFDGKTWRANDSFSAVDTTLRAKPKGTSVRQSVTIENMGEGWVPAAFEPVAISGDVDFVYNPESATVRVANDKTLARGLEYNVTSVIASHTVRQLNGATANKPPSDRYLELPKNYPDDLREIAANVVEGKSSPYQRAVALQDWFREEFTYDLDVSYGSGVSAMREFLVERRGYCEQFATTFAAFARSLGIPSRVAIGFTPGVVDSDRYVVRARNAHAWPEVWFDKVGWVSFAPTPGRGAPGTEQYTGVQPAQDETVGPDSDENSPGTDTVPATDVPTTDATSAETTEVPAGSESGPSGSTGAGV